MKASIMESLQALYFARPPIVIFIISLVIMAASLFLLAFYIKDKDLLLDLHTQEDWNSLISILSSQKLCLNISDPNQPMSSSHASSSSLTQLANSRNTTTVSATVSSLHVNLLQWHKLGYTSVSFVGQISSKGWRQSCQQSSAKDDSSENIGIALIVPQTKSLEYMKGLNVCVVLTVSSHNLPTAPTNLQKNNQCGALNISVHEIGKIFAKQPKDKTADICNDGNTLEIFYDITNDGPKTLLNDDKRLQIFSHLLQISYLLLGLVSVFLLVAVLQGRNHILTRQHVLLVEKETLS